MRQRPGCLLSVSQHLGDRAEFVGLLERLLEEAQVAAVPGIAFGSDAYLRISYATSMENLEKGMERMARFVSSLQG